VITTAAERRAEQQSEHGSREQAPHGADYAHIWNRYHKRKGAESAVPQRALNPNVRSYPWRRVSFQ
jgi:hypothetical protein